MSKGDVLHQKRESRQRYMDEQKLASWSDSSPASSILLFFWPSSPSRPGDMILGFLLYDIVANPDHVPMPFGLEMAVQCWEKS
jgi:hypothetical protein